MTDNLTPEALDELEALAKAACLPDGDPHWMHMVDEEGDCPEKAKAIIWADHCGLIPVVTLENGEFSDMPQRREYEEGVLRFIGELDPAMVSSLIAAARERNTIAEERDEALFQCKKLGDQLDESVREFRRFDSLLDNLVYGRGDENAMHLGQEVEEIRLSVRAFLDRIDNEPKVNP